MADYNTKLPAYTDTKVDGMLKGRYADNIKNLIPGTRFKKIKKILAKKP